MQLLVLDVGLTDQLAQLLAILVGVLLIVVLAGVGELVDAVTALGLCEDAGAGAEPPGNHHDDHHQADVADDRVDVGHEGIEAHEADAVANERHHDKHRTEGLVGAGGQALTQRIEHADRGVEDHEEDDDRHDHAQHRADVVHHRQHRHVAALDGLDVQVQGDRGDDQHCGVQHSTHQSAHAGFLRG